MSQKIAWNILLIDDDEEEYLITREMLLPVRPKPHLTWAGGYEQGLAALEKPAAHFDAVLIDYDLGQHSGIQLIRKLVQRGLTSPLIMISGRGTHETEMEAVEAGAVLYLSKNEANTALLERSIRFAIERKQAEQALHDRSARLALVSDLASQLLQAQDPLSLLEHVQPGLEKLLGVNAYVHFRAEPCEDSRTPILTPTAGFPASVREHMGSIDTSKAIVGLVAQTRRPFIAEDVQHSDDERTRLIREVGFSAYACFPLIAEGELLGTLSYAFYQKKHFTPESVELLRTVTDLLAVAIRRKQVEQARIQSEQRFHTLVSMMPAAMYTCDTNGVINFYNEKAMELWGRTPDPNDMEQRFCASFDLEYPDGRKIIKTDTPMAAAAMHGTPTRSGEVVILYPNGTRRPVSVNIQPLFDPEGELMGAVNVFQDISSHKEMEDLLRVQKAELETRNRQLETLFEQAPVGMALFEAQPPYRVLSNNLAHQSFLPEPYNTLGVTGLGLEDFVPAEMRDEVWAIFEDAARAGKPVNASHYPFTSPDGERTWWNWMLIPISEGGRLSAFAVALVDVTEEVCARQQVETELKERQRAEDEMNAAFARMRSIVETDAIGINISNINGQIIHSNRYSLGLFGYTQEEMEAGLIRWDELTAPEYREADQKAIQQLKSMGACAPYEKEYIRRDGSRVWVSISSSRLPGDRGEVVSFISDISDRKRAESSAAAGNSRFRELADSMPQLVWTARPDGEVDYYNKRYAEFGGIQPEEDGLWAWGPVLHDDDLQPTTDAWMHSVATGEPYQIEHRVRLANGEYRWHLSRGVPARDAGGRIVRWYGTATDIHEQKVAQEALRELVKTVERSNLELKEFAYIASHDLQEPLRKIQAFGDSLARQMAGSLSPENEDTLRRITSAAHRMQGMINDLLSYSRVNTQERRLEPVDLNELAGEVVSDLEVRVRETGGQVFLSDLPVVYADPLQVRQLLQNLIGNALKFHRAGIPPLVRVSGRVNKAEGTAMLWVEDNGTGFDIRQQERIFQPFQRLHSRSEYEGTGIGLAICRKIVERHGGTLAAESEPGVGSRFTVSLPLEFRGD